MYCGKIRFSVVFIALLCVLAAQNSEGNRKLAEKQSFSDYGDSWDAINIDEDMAEQIWSYCSEELKNSTGAVKELNSDLSQWTLNSYINFDSSLMVVKKAISDLPPNKKEALLDCLREKTLTSQVEEETWLNKYQNLLSGWASVRRRYLRQKIHHRLVLRTASASAPAPTFFLAKFQVHVLSPTPEASPPQDFVNSPSPSTDNYYPSISTQNISPSPQKTSEKNRKYFVVAGAMSGVSITALFMLCFTKRNKIKIEPKDGQKNDKSFFNLRAIDIPPGSLRKANGVGNPSNETITVINVSSESKSHKPEAGKVLTDKSSSGLPLPPGRTAPSPPPAKPPAPAPPPPPKVSRPPPNPPRPHHRGRSSTGEVIETSNQSEAQKTKLKPFFWDKVLASSNRSMVWHEINGGSFQFSEEMMENLFGYATSDKKKSEHGKDSEAPQLIQIIDPRKSQNLAILLKALNVTTEEICDALNEGNELPVELIQTLLKMAPTSEEELKLRLYNGDVSNLGPAERFLKVMVEIPFAFKRLESLLFMSTYQEEVSSIKESHSTLEVACEELKNSRLFLKLLEAVLKTGNRMNNGTFRGGAQAFKLDTLLKLSDVKGIDGKTTLLHFVVQEITRSEGLRAAYRLKESQSMSSVKTEDLLEDSSSETEKYHRTIGLQVVSGLSDELQNVKKAALTDNEVLTASLSKLEHTLVSAKEFLEKEMKHVEGDSDFRDTLVGFVEHVESDVATLLEEEKRIMDMVKSTGDYFHGRTGKDEGSRLFVIIRDFLCMLDKACKDVKNLSKLPSNALEKETSTPSLSQESRGDSLPDYRQLLFPAIRKRHMDHGVSSDEEN